MDADVGQTSLHVTTRISDHQKMNSQVGQHLVGWFGNTIDIESKILDACLTVEKLMIISSAVWRGHRNFSNRTLFKHSCSRDPKVRNQMFIKASGEKCSF